MPHTIIENFECCDKVSAGNLPAQIPNDIHRKVPQPEPPSKEILINFVAFAKDYYELYGENVNYSSLQRN